VGRPPNAFPEDFMPWRFILLWFIYSKQWRDHSPLSQKISRNKGLSFHDLFTLRSGETTHLFPRRSLAIKVYPSMIYLLNGVESSPNSFQEDFMQWRFILLWFNYSKEWRDHPPLPQKISRQRLIGGHFTFRASYISYLWKRGLAHPIVIFSTPSPHQQRQDKE